MTVFVMQQSVGLVLRATTGISVGGATKKRAQFLWEEEKKEFFLPGNSPNNNYDSNNPLEELFFVSKDYRKLLFLCFPEEEFFVENVSGANHKSKETI